MAAHPIPRRLHFLWGFSKGEELPDHARWNLAAWRALHPEWEATVHGPETAEALARRAGQPWQGYAAGIQRCDVARPLLLREHGGVYGDFDLEPHRGLDALLARLPRAGVILCVERWVTPWGAWYRGRRQPIRAGRPETLRRVANYFMAGVAGHPFWDEVLALLRERAALPVRSDYDVLYATGPDVVTEAARRTRQRDVVVLSRRRASRQFTHHALGSWRA